MDEVFPGLLHWTTYHDGIGQTVHSHMHLASGAVFDPRLPDGGADALGAAGLPSVVLLSNRHHLRHSVELADAYGIPIRCHTAGLHEFDGAGRPDVSGFAVGDEVAAGVQALELGVLTPEETVFRISEGPGALLFADSLMRQDGELMLVPAGLRGDDPDAVEEGLRDRLQTLAEGEDFDVLLFAHGEPIRSGGKSALQTFLS